MRSAYYPDSMSNQDFIHVGERPDPTEACKAYLNYGCHDWCCQDCGRELADGTRRYHYLCDGKAKIGVCSSCGLTEDGYYTEENEP